MFVTVNGARLFFDVESPGLVPDGARMRELPTLVLLHGGPGFDHSMFKPAWGAALRDVAQIVYLDHRGNGRSEYGDPAHWNLAQWGDDVRAFCDVLGIERPIVCGVSFGGFVAQSYATRHPEHVGKLILVSTSARMEWDTIFAAFECIGGAEARDLAREFWLTPTAENRRRYRAECHPLYYTRRKPDADSLARSIVHDAVSLHFNGEGHESMRMDFRAALGGVTCPVLVLAGEQDPITPMAFSETIAACLPPALVRFVRVSDAGHGVVADDPARGFAALRGFIDGAL